MTPMSEMLSLLAYAKAIALAEGGRGTSFWSHDKSILFLRDKTIVMERFRQMAQDVVAELEETVWKLLWTQPNERFAVRLDRIVDDVLFVKQGESFATREENGMCNANEGRKLRPNGEWDKRRVASYLRRIDDFLELLLEALR